MTLTRKTGQLFLAPFTTKTPLEKAIHLISAYNISGFIFNPTFSANGKRFHSICTNLQQYATEEQPLLLAVDERSNTETIAKNSFTPLPTYKTIGTKNKRVFTKQLAEAIGKELHETGINTTFSSNLFTDNSAMSFSINPRQVAHHAVAMIQGYSKANITTICTINNEQLAALPTKKERSDIYKDNEHALYPLYQAVKRGVDIIRIPSNLFSSRLLEATTFIHNTLQYDRILLMEKRVTLENVEQVSEEVITALKSNVHLFSLSGPYKAQIQLITLLQQKKSMEPIIDRAITRINSMKETYTIALDKPYDSSILQTKRTLDLIEKFSS